MLQQRWLIYPFALLTILWFPSGNAGYATNEIGSFVKTCPIDGVPVCGARDRDYFLFPNQCLLNAANKDIFMGGRNFKQLPLRYCIHGCLISCPKDHRPVCALNLHTREKKVFANLCEVTKFSCQTNMEFFKLRDSDCEPPKTVRPYGRRSHRVRRVPIPCTNIYRPVCGTYLGVKSTFRNECHLNAENVKYDKDWRVVKNDICDEDYSNARLRLPTKSPKSHSIRKRSYDSGKNYEQYQNLAKLDEYKFQSPAAAAYKAPSEMPNINQYSNDYTMQTQPFQTSPHATITSDLKSVYTEEDIAKLLSSLSQSSGNDHSSLTVADQQYETTDAKPMQYAVENDMAYSYMPQMKANLQHQQNRSQNQVSSNQSPAVEQRYGENTSGKGPYYYPYHQGPQPGQAPRHEREETSKESSPMDSVMNMIRSELKPIQHQEEESPKKSAKEKITKKIIECKYGSEPVCAALSNGTVKTFENLCEMRTTNLYLKNTWVKLHEGPCDKCKYECSREYEPICVQRNGANYTMVNDCYFNMAICLDKISNWTKIADGECHRATPVIDRYANMKPGFQYTSSYFASAPTEKMPASTTESITTSDANQGGEVESTTPANDNDSFDDSESDEDYGNLDIPNHVIIKRSSDGSKLSTKSHIMHLGRSKGVLKRAR
ncbi:uncharacterized protein LOC106084918 isoform X1 [Stomoxys calcitrans]|uniref:uncharacterized protein LOC106084918 isoform X1 n=1 Tax=Stomoxys calcitrans TaxID=35570 RepID=UPI0027E378BA|nr:uncharacterized protein LOC106084918 isoform X1 [Stomoxys calcitrans]